MSLTLTLYKFSKRQNSTAVPDHNSGTGVSIDLKDQTQILTPTFILHWPHYPDYNYAEFMGRYYFISTIESIRNDIWALSCSVDLLATYKGNILATSAFVAYDTAANTEITDRRLSIKTTPVVAVSSANHATLGKGSCAIVTITGKTSTRSYAMEINDATYLLDNMEDWLDNVDMLPMPDLTLFTTVEEILGVILTNITQIGRQFIATGKASDSIKSAILLPVPLSALTLPSAKLYLGQYDTDTTHKYVTSSSRIVYDILNVTIPWQATDWRRNAPYHEIYLHIPYLGIISIPPSEVMGETSISVESTLDITSGNCIFRIYTSQKTIRQYSTNIASSFPIGASNVTPIQSATAIGAAAAAIGATVATGGAALPAVAAGTAGIVGVANSLQANPTAVGSNLGGAVLGVPGTTSCIVIYHDTTCAPDSVSGVIGTPENQVISLGGLSGYVETRCASVSGNMLESERTQLNKLLDGGIYIE